ncbi:MAG: DNA recombination protein RmuC [Alphaproteobacteria bacterium]|nr:DNA recombination protein RmuC [Alphaproteobacteria bacterium]
MTIDFLSLGIGLAVSAISCGVYLYVVWQKIEVLKEYLHEESLNRVAAETTALRVPELEQRVEKLHQELSLAKNQATELKIALEQERNVVVSKMKLLEEAEGRFTSTFKALSADALAQSNQSFLQLAQSTFAKFHQSAQEDLHHREKAISELVDPVKQVLGGVEAKLQELEKARLSSYEVLKHQVIDLVASQKELRLETANLVKALRAPAVRGRWGEIQLRRVGEMSGLSAHCDFIEQVHLEVEDGRLRPDMIVNLPGNKQIVIDAKAPLSAYLEALEATNDGQRIEYLRQHARQVRTHILQLSSRAYWDQLPLASSPEFVVLFLPGETFFSAALEYEPDLIELAVEKKVIMTTPSTLIALLHAVAYGWRQESLAANARQISDLGRDIYKRLSDMGKHMSKLGRDLGMAVKSYNHTVGSLERRVLPSARKFKELEATSPRDEIEHLIQLDQIPRDLESLEELGLKEGEAA